ncbi:MAG: hypothetical protein JSV84_11620 [Gemmatimonadota bacterium]|nr:MAG: hypothetical protein JSV84_11620 [Gemmatimonadota bacterium]
MKILSTILIGVFTFCAAHVFGEANSGCDGLARRTSAKFPAVVECISTPDPQSPSLPQDRREAPKSPGKAFFLSLLVPGLGEWYAGSPQKGKIFLAAEAAVWSSFAAFEHYSAWKKRDYELYSVAHANVSLEGKDDDFFKHVAAYTDVRSYNEDRLHAREWNDVYWDEDFYHWQWDSPESREKFNEVRDASRKAHRRALNMVGAAVLNRVISAIDAVRTAKTFNKKVRENDTGFHLGFKVRGSIRNPKALIVLNKNF